MGSFRLYGALYIYTKGYLTRYNLRTEVICYVHISLSINEVRVYGALYDVWGPLGYMGPFRVYVTLYIYIKVYLT